MTNNIVPSRLKEIEKVLKYLNEDENRYIHVFGGRGIGKTYFLNKVRESLVEKSSNIVIYYKFRKRPELSLEDWIVSLFKKMPKFELGKNEGSQILAFRHLLNGLKDPNYVKSPKKIILLLDDFHNINEYINHQVNYYNFLEMLYDKTDNFSVLAATIKSYSEGESGGSPFFLNCCSYFPNLRPFTSEDIQYLLPDTSEEIIREITRKTGGQPELTLYLLHLMEKKEISRNITKKHLKCIWNEFYDRISLEKFIHHLNADEREILEKIAINQQYQEFVDLKIIFEKSETRRKTETQLKMLKDTGLVEHKGIKGIFIPSEILKKKIIDNHFSLQNIRGIIDDGEKIQEEFNFLGIKDGIKIKEWLVSEYYQNYVALIPNIDDYRSFHIALEIAALANTYSGIICFGLDNRGFIADIINEEEILLKVRGALDLFEKRKPEFNWGSFFVSGNELKCILVKKMRKDICIEGKVYVKCGGFPIDKTRISKLSIPEFRELNKTGYLFFLDLYNFEPPKGSKIRKYIGFDRNLLSDSNNIDLFIQWIEENRGEGVMIELKGEIPLKSDEKDHIRGQMVAMANTKSGVLVSGIIEHDDGGFEIQGIKNPDKEEQLILNLKNHPKMRNVEGEFQQINYNNKTLITFFIRKPDKLASYNGDVYKRNGRQKEKIKPENIPFFLEDNFEQGPFGFVVLMEFGRWKKRKV